MYVTFRSPKGDTKRYFVVFLSVKFKFLSKEVSYKKFLCMKTSSGSVSVNAGLDKFHYRLVLCPVTLSDPNYPKPSHFRHFIAFYIFVVSGGRNCLQLPLEDAERQVRVSKCRR